MAPRPLGKTGLQVTPIGFGAFKIGRAEKHKYPKAFPLPDASAVERLLNGILDLGINYIDTAPAYGVSEERIGASIGHRRAEYVLSTKVGETFEDGRSTYDFRSSALQLSIERSLRLLRTDVIDILYLHTHADDVAILHDTDAVAKLIDFRERGLVRAIGLSGKSVAAARESLAWADVLMVEYHANDTTHGPVMAEAAARGVGVTVKKGLASGHLPAEVAIHFVLGRPEVGSMVIGGLDLAHMRQNIEFAKAARH